MKNNTGTLNIVAQRAMRPGQVLETSIKMKEHCKLDKFLIFLIKRKVNKSSGNKGQGRSLCKFS